MKCHALSGNPPPVFCRLQPLRPLKKQTNFRRRLTASGLTFQCHGIQRGKEGCAGAEKFTRRQGGSRKAYPAWQLHRRALMHVHIPRWMHLHKSSRPSDASLTMRRPSDEVTEAWLRLMRVRSRVLDAGELDLKKAGFPPLAWVAALVGLSRAAGGG